MVTLTFFTPVFGGISNGDDNEVTQVIHHTSHGKDIYYFTLSSIYGSTMFGVDHSGGHGDGSLFLGRANILPNGNAGFEPVAEYSGSIDGVAVDKFAADYVTGHGSNVGLTAALLAGDDIIHPAGGYNQVATVYCGDGKDFVFMTDAYVWAYGQGGPDTFYFDGVQPDSSFPYTRVYDFERGDRLQLDPSFFTALSNGFTKDNLHYGSAAADSNDYIIVNGSSVYYDPDGSGAAQGGLIATTYFAGHTKSLKFGDFLISSAHPGQSDHSSDLLHPHSTGVHLHTEPLHLAIV